MKKLAIGLMSGTSGDGLSIVLASFQNRKFDLIHYDTFPYPAPLAAQILAGPNLTAGEISRLNIDLGDFFAKALLKFMKKWKISASSIAVIGSHGQTIYHGPNDSPPNTLQIGEPSVIAERTGIPVVADFRMRDLALGGQGAPLIPFFDQYFFGNDKLRALQNIGGIGNVTVVGNSRVPLLTRRCPHRGSRARSGDLRIRALSTIAFDTGPGNCLIDWAVRKVTRGRLRYDPSGRMARRGHIDIKAVHEMAGHPYFRKRPPKSTGRELFNESFIPCQLVEENPEDLIATLTYFTAHSIHESYQRFIRGRLSEIIVSGGGALNLTLMAHLAKLLSPIPVRSIQDFGLHVQAKEPLAFAFYALKTIEGKPTILGKIIPGNRLHATS